MHETVPYKHKREAGEGEDCEVGKEETRRWIEQGWGKGLEGSFLISERSLIEGQGGGTEMLTQKPGEWHG